MQMVEHHTTMQSEFVFIFSMRLQEYKVTAIDDVPKKRSARVKGLD